jgi:hypothetical protein
MYSTGVSVFKTIPEHIDVFFPSWHEFKNFPHGKDAAPAHATIHEKQFPLPHYSETGHLPSDV